MPTTEEIEAQDSDPLSPLLRERIREILQYSFSEMASLNATLDALSPEQCQYARAMIAVWDGIGDETARITGGVDALDADPERNREHVRRRIRNLLGLPEISGIGTLDRSQVISTFRIQNKWSGGGSEV